MIKKYLSIIVLLFSVQSSRALEIPVVAVFDLEADKVSEQTAFLCSDFLRKHLADIGRVTIKERDEMDKMLQAQGENLSDCTEEGCAVKLGQFLDVEKIITGKVTKTGSRYIVVAKYIDLETAQIEFQEDITIEGITEDKLTDYIQSLAEKIASRVTLIGSVIEAEDEILLDIGKSVGIQVGDRCQIKRWGREIRHPQTDELLEKEKQNIGEVEIVRLIGDKVSGCKSVSGSGFQVGDFIEYKGAVRGQSKGSGTVFPITTSPVAPSNAAKSYSSVLISTDPSGASVYLDGDDYGETPVRRDDVETGEYTLVLHKDGYVDAVQMLTVDRGRTADVNVKLVKQVGSLKITCSPSDANIYLDGTYKGTAGSGGLKLDYLSVGSYTVKAEAESFYPEEKAVSVHYNETVEVKFNLKPKPGAVFVVSTPGGAEVYLDNRKQSGKTPYKVNDVSTGSHRVKVFLDGYQANEKPVDVDAEKTSTISFDLVKVEVPTPAPSKTGGGSFSGVTTTGPLSGMTFVKIPGGSFRMGSNESKDEKPVHSVSIKPFYMMTTEVTQKMWKELMGSNPSHFKGDNLPVEKVSWNDCQKFIEKLNQRDPGKGYRLPTEAEWEYACRAGTTTKYYSGNSESDLKRAGWYSGNSGKKTHIVGQKSPNSWGLYDMSGNVWEWCTDWYHNSYSGAPTDGSAWISPSSTYRVLRGGSWYYFAFCC
ncbi:MAG: SUMF1/EgtB/PvdO family nonheme iron enzyme, partial [FCB group bacterium]|nr:SUMF1/EgtB/PvdO family nonheme iron enzyme [FCB group bacterium]